MNPAARGNDIHRPSNSIGENHARNTPNGPNEIVVSKRGHHLPSTLAPKRSRPPCHTLTLRVSIFSFSRLRRHGTVIFGTTYDDFLSDGLASATGDCWLTVQQMDAHQFRDIECRRNEKADMVFIESPAISSQFASICKRTSERRVVRCNLDLFCAKLYLTEVPS